MSTQAMFWALKLPELRPGPWRVLMLICDAANSESNVSWLSLARLCRESGMGRSTVIRHIQQLHSDGYIVPGDKRYVAHLPHDRRPNVWMPNVHRGTPSDLRGQTLPFTDRGVKPGPRDGVSNWDPAPDRGPSLGPNGVSNWDPNQELEPTDQLKSVTRPQLAREASDLGTPTPDAVPPTAALDHIAACRAALRKEDHE